MKNLALAALIVAGTYLLCTVFPPLPWLAILVGITFAVKLLLDWFDRNVLR